MNTITHTTQYKIIFTIEKDKKKITTNMLVKTLTQFATCTVVRKINGIIKVLKLSFRIGIYVMQRAKF